MLAREIGHFEMRKKIVWLQQVLSRHQHQAVGPPESARTSSIQFQRRARRVASADSVGVLGRAMPARPACSATTPGTRNTSFTLDLPVVDCRSFQRDQSKSRSHKNVREVFRQSVSRGRSVRPTDAWSLRIETNPSE